MHGYVYYYTISPNNDLNSETSYLLRDHLGMGYFYSDAPYGRVHLQYFI